MCIGSSAYLFILKSVLRNIVFVWISFVDRWYDLSIYLYVFISLELIRYE